MQDIRTIRITTDSMLRGLLLLAAAGGVYLLRETLLLVVVSIVIASFVEAGVKMFAQYRITRTLAVPIIFATVIIFISAIFYTFVPIVFRELSGMIGLLIGYIPDSSTLNSQAIDGATQFVNNLTEKSSLNDFLVTIKNSSAMLSQGATSVIGATFGGILNTILIVVMSFYLSIQEKGIDNFLRILTPKKHEAYVIDLWGRAQRKIGIWFKGQLLLGLAVGAVTIVVLALMGVQYAFIIGLVSGIAELVPFGCFFAAIPAILFAVIDGGVVLGIKVMIFFVVIQQIESYVLAPVVARRMVGIPPLVVLLAFIMGITIAGFWGAIIAIPVAVFVLEYLSDVEKEKLTPILINSEN
ncbi:AI-2E family transporter [Patescibacteria group bacterium]|nr:AI-2E family transporter [Patescibacteria group bacterium]